MSSHTSQAVSASSASHERCFLRASAIWISRPSVLSCVGSCSPFSWITPPFSEARSETEVVRDEEHMDIAVSKRCLSSCTKCRAKTCQWSKCKFFSICIISVCMCGVQKPVSVWQKNAQETWECELYHSVQKWSNKQTIEAKGTTISETVASSAKLCKISADCKKRLRWRKEAKETP